MALPPLARIVLALLVCCLALSGPASANRGTGSPTPTELELLRAVNDVRQARGLRRVRLVWPLQARAHRYAYRLMRADRFAHASLPVGVRENLALGSARVMEAKVVVRWWLASPPHRRTLLWPQARKAGFGVAGGRFWRYRGTRIAVARLRR